MSSVRPPVCDVSGSGPHGLEILETLIARTTSPTPSLFVSQGPPTYSQGNMEKFWETRGWEKSGLLEHKGGNISETRKDKGKVTMEGV